MARQSLSSVKGAQMENLRLQKLQAKWEAQIAEWNKARDALLDMRENGADADAVMELQRTWWLMVSSILMMMARAKSQWDVDLSPMPIDSIAALSQIAQDLSNGNIAPEIRSVAAEGRGRWTAMERYHMANAVCYVEAAKAGRIPDRSPVKTVRQAYGVSAQTVRDWIDRQAEVCFDMPAPKFLPDELAEKMRKSGARYRMIGRSMGAVERRSAKRRRHEAAKKTMR